MNQLTQQLKSGKMELLQVPIPSIGRGQVLVNNYYSVISSGTEGKTVTDARKGYIAKARSRQKELKTVINAVKNQGVFSTYKIVMNKLEAPSPLGYSCAGEVLAVADDIKDIKPGDFVACGGQGAYHAEVVSAGRNLCAKIDKNIDIRHAAFTTISAIAVQGIRQADLQFGEYCVVIGLGLVGQITLQILRASGINSIGIDIDENQLDIARRAGADYVFNRKYENIEQVIKDYTSGFGADAVIITAATSSADPVNLAGTLCRRKARVIIVGVVPTGFDRDKYYKKELDLRMSCSYGPGRYDADYEEKGYKYPMEYVRWTETRNMEAYLNLLQKNKLNIEALITHEFDFEKAPEAYNLILEKKETFCGILLRYEPTNNQKDDIVIVREKSTVKVDIPQIGFIGAGSFAQNILIPGIKGNGKLIGVATARSHTSRGVADKYGFEYCTCNSGKIVDDEKINTIFIATRHNLHAEYVLKAIKNNKNVFVEKPICMNSDELEEIKSAYNDSNVHVMVGFNRRFAPHIKTLNSIFVKDRPKAITYRINAGNVPPDHWTHDPDIGGGRIIGEVCHFIDLASFIAGSHISSIRAVTIKDAQNLQDTLSIVLDFDNRSIASISYFSNGNNKVPKEYIEVFCDSQVAIIDDFKTMKIIGKRIKKHKLSKQDKGHKEEIKEFLNAVNTGSKTPIPFFETYHSTLATFKVLESIRNGTVVHLNK